MQADPNNSNGHSDRGKLDSNWKCQKCNKKETTSRPAERPALAGCPFVPGGPVGKEDHAWVYTGETESEDPQVKRDDKGFGPDVPRDDVNWKCQKCPRKATTKGEIPPPSGCVLGASSTGVVDTRHEWVPE
jgi:ribosomal protein L37AE/L43A